MTKQITRVWSFASDSNPNIEYQTLQHAVIINIVEPCVRTLQQFDRPSSALMAKYIGQGRDNFSYGLREGGFTHGGRILG